MRRRARRFASKVRKTLIINQKLRQYQRNGAGYLATNPGTQGFIDTTSMHMQEYRNILASLAAETPTIVPPTTANTRLTFKKYTNRYQIKNFANIPINLTIYEYTSRIDTDSTAGSPTIFAYSGGIAWTNGMTTTGNDAIVGNRPFDSYTFTQNFRVRKTRNIILGVGRHIIHKIKRNNFTISYNDFVDADSVFRKNHTVGLLLVIYGTPMIVDGGGALPTVGPAKIGYTQSSRFQLRNEQDWLPDVSKLYTIGTALLSGPGKFIDYTSFAAAGTTAGWVP